MGSICVYNILLYSALSILFFHSFVTNEGGISIHTRYFRDAYLHAAPAMRFIFIIMKKTIINVYYTYTSKETRKYSSIDSFMPWVPPNNMKTSTSHMDNFNDNIKSQNVKKKKYIL